MPHAEGDAELYASQMRSEAAVDPAAEADVAVGRPVEVDDFGSFVDTLVGDRGADQAHDLIARLERAAAELDVLGGDTGERKTRRFEAHRRAIGDLPRLHGWGIRSFDGAASARTPRQFRGVSRAPGVLLPSQGLTVGAQLLEPVTLRRAPRSRFGPTTEKAFE